MADNGLDISVSREKFTGMDQEERDWVLYQAIQQINHNGCRWAQGRWKRMFGIGAGTGALGGFLAVLGKWWLSNGK